jgi:hypothetical protein
LEDVDDGQIDLLIVENDDMEDVDIVQLGEEQNCLEFGVMNIKLVEEQHLGYYMKIKCYDVTMVGKEAVISELYSQEYKYLMYGVEKSNYMWY